MKNMNNYEYLLEDLTKLKGVGKKTSEILKNARSTIGGVARVAIWRFWPNSSGVNRS